MIKLLGKIPKGKFYVACSGGVDSMVALAFLKAGGHDCKALFINHNTDTSASAHKFLMDTLEGDFYAEQIPQTKPAKMSWEEFWREERYKLFHSFEQPIVTAHHLDDQVETWLMGAMHGQPKLIPYRNSNVVRPFMLNTKSELIEWAENHDIKWIEDETNMNYAHARNRVRHEIIPEVMEINPGIHKVIAKKVRLLTSGEK